MSSTGLLLFWIYSEISWKNIQVFSVHITSWEAWKKRNTGYLQCESTLSMFSLIKFLKQIIIRRSKAYWCGWSQCGLIFTSGAWRLAVHWDAMVLHVDSFSICVLSSFRAWLPVCPLSLAGERGFLYVGVQFQNRKEKVKDLSSKVPKPFLSHSFGQSKPHGHPRFKDWENRFHLLMEGVTHFIKRRRHVH